MYFGENVIYVYDGTFDGMMCCVFESVYKKEMPYEIFSEDNYVPSMFSFKNIETDKQKAVRVYNSIVEKMGDFALDLVQTMFLSCVKTKEMSILKFMLFGYKNKMDAVKMMANKNVTPMLITHKAVKSEAHHFKGFVRFTDYNGALVAFISPKNFVLPYLKTYFCVRYRDDNFMIYDKTHKVALIYEKGKAEIVAIENLEVPQIDEEEQRFRDMWVEFYKTVAIAARVNPKCRMTNMPKRYWANMLEVKDELNCNVLTLSSQGVKNMAN